MRQHAANAVEPQAQRRLWPARPVVVVATLLALIAALLSWQSETPARAAISALAGKTVTQVSTGAAHTCAVTSDGQVACWGQNVNGQLGNGTLLNSSVPTFVTTVGTPLDGKTVAQVTTGTSHTCAVTSDGIVACWGLQTNGRLGNGVTAAADIQVPTAVIVTGTPLDTKQVASLSAGAAHTCAVATDATAVCWGSNGNGRLGDGTTAAKALPTAIATTGTPLDGLTIDVVRAGGTFSCAHTVSGVAACWGRNTNGQLGDTTLTQRTVPTAIATTGTVLDGLTLASIDTGTAHTCALSTTGVAACWGLQTNGRLGNNLTTAANVTTPVAVTIPGTVLAGKTINSISTGGAHTCATSVDATTACWGNNGNGRLGDGTTTQRAVPTAVSTANTPLDGLTVAMVRGGGAYTCAVATDGIVACWGLNSNNQLGDGTATRRLRPVAVITLPVFGITSVTGQRSGVLGYARAGDDLVLGGSWWSPGVTSGGFTATVGGAAASNTLTTDSSGALAGSVTVPAGAAPGPGSLVLTQGADVVNASINVLGDRSVAVIPVSGGIPTTVSVTAQRFDPTAAVEIRGVTDLTGPVDSVDAAVNGTISGAGSLSATNYTINDPDTVAVVVRETSPDGNPATDFASADFSVDPVTAIIDSVTGQRSGVVDYARSGDTLVLSGSGWASSLSVSAFAVSVCDTVGTSCDPVTPAAMSTDGSGELTGQVTVPAGVAAGDRTVRIEQDLRSTLVAFTALGDRSVSLVPVTGGAGTSVSVTGTDFDPSALLSISGVTVPDGSTPSGDAAVAASATSAGQLAATTFTVNDPATVAIMVVEIAPDGDPALDRAFGSFTVLPVVAVVDEVTGQRAGVNTHARSGDVLVMSGEFWAPNLSGADLTAALCTTDGIVCDPAATNDLVTDASGEMSGTIDVSASATAGDRSLKVVSVNGESLTPLTILGDRTLDLASNSVTLGGSVDVSGTDFDIAADVIVAGAVEVGPGTVTYSTDAPIAVISDTSGNVDPVTFTIDDVATAFLVIAEVGPDGDPVVDRSTAAIQVITPTYSLGLRSFAVAGNPDPTTVAFGGITTPLAPTPLPGNLNRLEVVDDRNGTYGWALTASLSDFTSPSGATIDKSALVASPVCSATEDSAPGFVSGGPNQSFGGLVQLCSKDDQVGTGGTTSGIYTIDSGLILTIPSFQAADTYSAVLTVTLA